MSTSPARLQERIAVLGYLATMLLLTGCPWTSSGPSTVLPWGSSLPLHSVRNPQPPEGVVPEQTSDSAKAADTEEAPDYQVMAFDLWTRVIGTPDDSGGRRANRWQYPDFEDLLARPLADRPNLALALNSSDPIVAANAAIGLARLGDAKAIDQLAKTIGNPDLKLPLRQAAVEALAGFRDPNPAPLLSKLLDQYGDLRPQAKARYLAGLHAELIRGLSWHVDPTGDSRFVDALGGYQPVQGDAAAGGQLVDPPDEVKLEALRVWIAAPTSRLPPEAVRLRTDNNPTVRATALEALGTSPNADAFRHLKSALNDSELEVRAAAIAALGKLRTPEARTTLEKVLDEQPVGPRVEAVRALAAMGAERAVLGAAADKSWQVRTSVAKSLSDFPGRKAASVARQLLEDPSCAVQEQVVIALAAWSLADAGPILLAAMRSNVYLTRRTAAEQLAIMWPPAAAFPFDGSENERVEVIEELTGRFRDQIGMVDDHRHATSRLEAETVAVQTPAAAQAAEIQRYVETLSEAGLTESSRRRAVAALIECGPELVDVLEQLAIQQSTLLPEPVYRQVLPSREPVFEVLDRLASRNVVTRRLAAEDLVKLTEKGPLRPLALGRLASLGMTQTDSLVWQGLLTAVAADAREPSIRLAYAAIGNASPEIRRRACQYLASHAEASHARGRHARVLIAALEDRNTAVVRAAVRALGRSGQPEAVQPLRRLLVGSGESLRVDLAVALARLDDRSGPLELERLSYSTNETVRREVAIAMGEVADRTLVPSLIRLLDDQQSIRRGALASLPRVVGHDVAELSGGPSLSASERVEIWKSWHDTQPNLLGSRPAESARPR